MSITVVRVESIRAVTLVVAVVLLAGGGASAADAVSNTAQETTEVLACKWVAAEAADPHPEAIRRFAGTDLFWVDTEGVRRARFDKGGVSWWKLEGMPAEAYKDTNRSNTLLSPMDSGRKLMIAVWQPRHLPSETAIESRVWVVDAETGAITDHFSLDDRQPLAVSPSGGMLAVARFESHNEVAHLEMLSVSDRKVLWASTLRATKYFERFQGDFYAGSDLFGLCWLDGTDGDDSDGSHGYLRKNPHGFRMHKSRTGELVAVDGVPAGRPVQKASDNALLVWEFVHREPTWSDRRTWVIRGQRVSLDDRSTTDIPELGLQDPDIVTACDDGGDRQWLVSSLLFACDLENGFVMPEGVYLYTISREAQLKPFWQLEKSRNCAGWGVSLVDLREFRYFTLFDRRPSPIGAVAVSRRADCR